MFDILEQVINQGQGKNYLSVQAVLQYLPSTTSQKNQEDNLKVKEDFNSELEEEIKLEEIESEFVPLRYALPQELIPEFSYSPLTSQQLYGVASVLDEDEKKPTQQISEEYTAPPDEEARDNLQETKYAALTGSEKNLDYQDQHKLALWIMFNQSAFSFLESFYNLSRDVNYKVTM